MRTQTIPTGTTEGHGTLLDPGEHDDFQQRWRNLEAGFVDDPNRTVAAADELSRDVIERIRDKLQMDRAAIAERWKRNGEDLTTEDLRKLTQDYRTLIERLLETT